MTSYDAAAANTATAAANTEVVITLAASANQQRALKQVMAHYSGAPTGGLLTIESPAATVVRRIPVTTTERIVDFPGDGLRFPGNQAVVIRLSAGGSGVIGYLNITPSVTNRAI